jgi:hypothetical protein
VDLSARRLLRRRHGPGPVSQLPCQRSRRARGLLGGGDRYGRPGPLLPRQDRVGVHQRPGCRASEPGAVTTALPLRTQDSDAKIYAALARSRTVFYTPTVGCTNKQLLGELTHLTHRVEICIDQHLHPNPPLNHIRRPV